jgi:hypothetical protein
VISILDLATLFICGLGYDHPWTIKRGETISGKENIKQEYKKLFVVDVRRELFSLHNYKTKI